MPDADDAESAEIARIRAQQRMAIDALRNSFQYRLGDTLVRAVTSRSGAKAAPRKLFQLFKEARAHRSHKAEIPAWSGTSRRSLVAASVLDDFSHLCLAPELTLDPLNPDVGLAASRVSLVLCETAWQGNGGAWAGAFSRPASQQADALQAILAQAKSRGIPSVLWNKEDPPNFEVFLEAASWFDHVFTSDASLLDEYKLRLGHDRVAPLLFGAQPAVHNPIGSELETADRIAFAGSWRADKYPERTADTRMLLDATLASTGTLDIFDRFADLANTELRFPVEYQSSVRGALPYVEMAESYRRYAAFLNVNSVTRSPTMVSRRVFEVLASRTPVISAPSAAVESIFGDTVLVATNKAQAQAHVDRVLHDVEFRTRQAHRGYRLVHSTHTYARRVDQILDATGIDGHRAPLDPHVCVVLVSNRADRLDRALANYEQQLYQNRELIFVTNSAAFDHAIVDRRVVAIGGRTLHIDERATLADCLNEALAKTDAEYFAKFDDDDDYGPHYLGDQMLAFGYSDASVVGKHSYFVRFEADDSMVLRFPGHEFSYVDKVQGGTLVVRRRDISGISFQPVQRGTDTKFINEVRGAGLQVFSTDRFNYVLERRIDKASHTWDIADSEIRQSSTAVSSATDATL